MDAEKLNQALYDKMAAEQERFKHGLLGMTVEEALNYAHEYTIREDILLEIEALGLPASQAEVLLESESPLADIYNDFQDMETGHMDDIQECIENRANHLLEAQLEALPRKDIARRSIADNGKIIVTDSLDKAVEAANRIAPEHLELCVDEPFALLPRIKNAGSVFLGRSTPEALGDYFAGPNHTLPTSGTARFSSPLGVDDFMKRSSFLSYDQAALNACGDRIADFARREGLEGHARSAESRKKSE